MIKQGTVEWHDHFPCCVKLLLYPCNYGGRSWKHSRETILPFICLSSFFSWILKHESDWVHKLFSIFNSFPGNNALLIKSVLLSGMRCFLGKINWAGENSLYHCSWVYARNCLHSSKETEENQRSPGWSDIYFYSSPNEILSVWVIQNFLFLVKEFLNTGTIIQRSVIFWWIAWRELLWTRGHSNYRNK